MTSQSPPANVIVCERATAAVSNTTFNQHRTVPIIFALAYQKTASISNHVAVAIVTSPLAQGERIKVRGSKLKRPVSEQTLTHPLSWRRARQPGLAANRYLFNHSNYQLTSKFFLVKTGNVFAYSTHFRCLDCIRLARHRASIGHRSFPRTQISKILRLARDQRQSAILPGGLNSCPQ